MQEPGIVPLNFWDIETNFGFKLKDTKSNVFIDLEPKLYPIYTFCIECVQKINAPLPYVGPTGLIQNTEVFFYMTLPCKIKYLHMIQEHEYEVNCLFLNEKRQEATARFYKVTGDCSDHTLTVFKDIDTCAKFCDRQNIKATKKFSHYINTVYPAYIQIYKVVKRVIEREWCANSGISSVGK